MFTIGIGALDNKTSAVNDIQYNNISSNDAVSVPIIQYDKIKGKKCNNQIVKLTQKSINCESFCGSSYTKKTLTEKNLYAGLEPGVYCIPYELDTCHPHTGMIVKDAHGWSCISKYPFVFGGADADEIISCNGDIIDRIDPGHPVTYKNKIPRELKIFDNPETEKNSIGEWRFVCPKRYDSMNNQYVSTDVSRLHEVRNVCAQMLVNDAARSIPDFVNGSCICPDRYLEYNDNRIGPYCAPDANIVDKPGIKYFYEPCLKPNQPTDDALKPCPIAVYDDVLSSSLNRYEIGISTMGLSNSTYNDLNKAL